MNTGLPSGVWSYPDGTFPGHDSVMWIDSARRRIITIVVIKLDPLRRTAMRIWYEPESETSIRIRLKPTEAWRNQEFKLEPDRLTWIHPGRSDQPGRRLSPNEYPDWLR